MEEGALRFLKPGGGEVTKVSKSNEEIILLSIFHLLISYLEDYEGFGGGMCDLSYKTFRKVHYETNKGIIDDALAHLGATLEECRFSIYFMPNGLQEVVDSSLMSSEVPTSQKYKNHHFGIGVEFDTLFLARLKGLQLVHIRPKRNLNTSSIPNQNTTQISNLNESSLSDTTAAWLILGKDDFIDSIL
jgi:hypothetical protein